VGWGESLAVRDAGQHLRLRFLFELWRDGSKDHHRRVARVPHLARSGVRNEDRAVVAGEVVAHLQLAIHHADHGEMHAVDRDILPDGRASAEQLLSDSTTDECYATMLL